MKVILTESQLNEIVIIEGVKNFLEESVELNETSDTIKSQLRNALIAGVACASIIAGIFSSGKLSLNQKQELAAYVRETDAQMKEPGLSYEELVAQGELHQAKVEELERCMKEKYLRLKGYQAYNPEDIVLSAEEMVTACEEYGYDLVLAAAQAWNESAWGTTPRAKKSNSVFSVGSYDNGKDAVKYDTVDASIRPYIELMQNKYSMNDDTMNNIFSGKSELVNDLGMRYASSTDYEKNLRITYNSIKKNYPILSWDLQTYMKNKKGEL